MRLIAIVMSVILFAAPAYAGKDKTDDAWKYEVRKVAASISDKSAADQIDALKDQMDSGYNSLDRGDYYQLASKVFRKLDALSAKFGGAKVKKPGWID